MRSRKAKIVRPCGTCRIPVRQKCDSRGHVKYSNGHTLYILDHLSIADGMGGRSRGGLRRWHRGRKDQSMQRKLERARVVVSL